MTDFTPSVDLLTAEEAFAVMYEFLKIYWRELGEALVADVLSESQPAYGGQSADPGAWANWLRCVAIVREAK